MDLDALRRGPLQAGAKVEAWPFVLVRCEWRRKDVIAGARGDTGERGSRRARTHAGRRLWSLIVRAGGPGGRHAFETRHVSDGRGWAGEVDEGTEARGLVLLYTGRRTGRIESWGAQEVRVECKVVSTIGVARRSIRETSWFMT